MKNRLVRIVLVLGISVIIALGKNYASKKINSVKTSTQSSETSQDSQENQDNLEITKYNAYMGMKNYTESSFYQIIDLYVGEFGSEEAFKVPKDTSRLSVLTLEPDSLDEALAASDLQPSYAKADADVKEMHAIYTQLVKITDELNQYYKAKSYVDDDFAKAKELHPNYISLASQFDALYTDFAKEFSVIISATQEKELKEVKDRGLMITYSSLIYFNSIDDIFDELDAQKITDENITKIDLEKLKPLYAKLAENHDELKKQLADKSMLELEGFSGDVAKETKISTYSRTVTDLKADLVDLIKRVEEKDELSASDLQMAETALASRGTIGSFNNYYNELISSYNFLIS